MDVFSSNFLCPLCRNQPLMCPGRCKEIITGCASPLNQAIVQLDASFRLILCKQYDFTHTYIAIQNHMVTMLCSLHIRMYT